jgi:hypothetical protein
MMWSAIICGLGLLGSVWYIIYWYSGGKRRRAACGSQQQDDLNDVIPDFDHRPWRPVGAMLCGLISVGCFIGINYDGMNQSPIAFIAFWILILIMLVWLFWLAARDMLYTRSRAMELAKQKDIDGGE